MTKLGRRWRVWLLRAVDDKRFPFILVGENLNYRRGHRLRNFRWQMPLIKDPRFDFTNAIIEPSALRKMIQLTTITELNHTAITLNKAA